MKEKINELKPEYYFKDMKACPCLQAFKGIEYVWEALKKKQKAFNIKDKDKIIIGGNTSIDQFVKIEGPVIIGDNCVIKKGAYIRSYTIIGNNCKIGHNSEVKNSILFDNVTISEKTYVGDSILGKDAWVATGVTLGNYKLNQKNIRVLVHSRLYDTGLKKLGCIVGDSVKIGNHLVFNPGTLIGPETVFFIDVPRFFPSKKIYKVNQVFKEREK